MENLPAKKKAADMVTIFKKLRTFVKKLLYIIYR